MNSYDELHSKIGIWLDIVLVAFIHLTDLLSVCPTTHSTIIQSTFYGFYDFYTPIFIDGMYFDITLLLGL